MHVHNALGGWGAAGEPGGGIVGIVGCHLDVVTANPETWDFDPFQLTRAGDDGDVLVGGCVGGAVETVMIIPVWPLPVSLLTGPLVRARCTYHTCC